MRRTDAKEAKKSLDAAAVHGVFVFLCVVCCIVRGVVVNISICRVCCMYNTIQNREVREFNIHTERENVWEMGPSSRFGELPLTS